MSTWTLKQAQHAYAMEIIKNRTPIWDLPRNDDESARYQKAWKLEQQMRNAETHKKRKDFVNEVSRYIHESKMTQSFAKVCISHGIEEWDVLWPHKDDLKLLRLYAQHSDDSTFRP